MSTMDTAKALIDLCSQGKNIEAIETMYTDDVVSVEAGAPPGGEREVHGKAAVLGKSQWWVDNHIVHSASITGPWPNGDKFIVGFTYDVTHKPNGQRFVMEEMALYTVRDGKICHEEFFYSMG